MAFNFIEEIHKRKEKGRKNSWSGMFVSVTVFLELLKEYWAFRTITVESMVPSSRKTFSFGDLSCFYEENKRNFKRNYPIYKENSYIKNL